MDAYRRAPCLSVEHVAQDGRSGAPCDGERLRHSRHHTHMPHMPGAWVVVLAPWAARTVTGLGSDGDDLSGLTYRGAVQQQHHTATGAAGTPWHQARATVSHNPLEPLDTAGRATSTTQRRVETPQQRVTRRKPGARWERPPACCPTQPPAGANPGCHARAPASHALCQGPSHTPRVPATPLHRQPRLASWERA